jgi:uncharacterized oxidoreductase
LTTIAEVRPAIKGVLMHRWAERDGTYDNLVAQRSQALAVFPDRH